MPDKPDTPESPDIPDKPERPERPDDATKLQNDGSSEGKVFVLFCIAI